MGRNGHANARHTVVSWGLHRLAALVLITSVANTQHRWPTNSQDIVFVRFSLSLINE